MISRRPIRSTFADNGADEALTLIGRDLRSARLERGEDLYDIADILRIRPVYLEALEAGDTAVMPGRPYVLGFLKSYADYLGLDGQALAQDFKGAQPGAVPPAALVYRTPAEEKARPTKALAALSIVCAVLVYGGWHAYSSGQLDFDATLSALPLQIGEVAADLVAGDGPPEAAGPAAVAVSTGAPAAALVVTAAEPPLDQLRLAAPEAAPEPGAALAAARPPSRDVASAQAAEAQPAASAGAMLAALETESPAAIRVFGGANDNGRIQLVARESSWVQVRSSARDYVRTRTLQSGDRLVLPNRSDLSLWTGNAGGVELMIDGRSVGVLGRRGDVVRELALDADQLLTRGPTPR